jgi:hypothetical protein
MLTALENQLRPVYRLGPLLEAEGGSDLLGAAGPLTIATETHAQCSHRLRAVNYPDIVNQEPQVIMMRTGITLVLPREGLQGEERLDGGPNILLWPIARVYLDSVLRLTDLRLQRR